MNLNKKTSLFKKATALALLLTFGQGSIAFAYDPYGTSFRGSAQTNTIVDMYSADQGDVSTLRLNGSARITNSKTKISLSLRDSDVQQVLRMLSDKAGLNIVFHESLNQDTATAGSGSMGGQKQKKNNHGFS